MNLLCRQGKILTSFNWKKFGVGQLNDSTMNNKKSKANQVYGIIPLEMEGVDALADLALDMRWSWNHEADKLWERIDPALWELTQNPWVVLQTVSHDQLERQLADPAFRHLMKEVQKSRDSYKQIPAI